MNSSPDKILIIDDDPFFLKVLGDAFTENGYSVFTANDGIEGVKFFLEKSPDAILCDLVMPRMGGVSTCIEIGRLAADNPPVIALLTSMFRESPHEHETPEMGAKIHIPKSTKPMDVVILIEQLLARNKYQQS
jgi:two-component system, OmpR family, response regulator